MKYSNRFNFLIFTLFMMTIVNAQDFSPSISTIGEVIRLSSELDQIIAEGTEIEVLAEGFDWSEGPLWIEEGGYLLFSDVPRNTIYKWKEGEGISTYLHPSGYTGDVERGGEMGSNGLLLNQDNQLVMCQHGDRRMAVMDASLSDPMSKFTTLASEFDNKRFNSPNDAVYHADGTLYFTDPPYGLEGGMKNPEKELEFQGVYGYSKERGVFLVTDDLTRPNGLAVNNDLKSLLIANSDSKHPVITEYQLNGEGNKVFFDTRHLMKEGVKGLPDGLKIRSDGVVFATGPGGILIIDAYGKHLGTISTGFSISNCAFDTKEEYIYGTSDMYLIRIKLMK